MNWECEHYRCGRTDVMAVVYSVLGSEFIRLLCPEHQPAGDVSEERRTA